MNAEDLGGGWYRYTVHGLPSAGGDFDVVLETIKADDLSTGANWDAEFVGVATEGFEVAHVQLEEAPTPGPVIRTTGAAASSVQSIYYLDDADMLAALSGPRIGLRVRFTPLWANADEQGDACLFELFCPDAGARNLRCLLLADGTLTLQGYEYSAGATLESKFTVAIGALTAGVEHQLVLRLHPAGGDGICAIGRVDGEAVPLERTLVPGPDDSQTGRWPCTTGDDYPGDPNPTALYLLTDSDGTQPLNAAISLVEVF